MKVSFNGRETELESRNLEAALTELGIDCGGVATSVNEEFVPKAHRSAVELKEGDRLEVVAPMQGG